MDGPLFTLCVAAAAGAVLVGVSAKLRVPSIALLLVGGVALGPEFANVVDPLNLDIGLKLVVGMAVAVILFEGGLTLDVEGARGSPVVIGRMLTVGVLITWAGTTAAVWWLFSPTLPMAILCGSLVIVTGPTVVAPILRRISVRDRIKHILYWESVLVDAIGVFLAVLCFEWVTPDADHGTWTPIVRFAIRVGVGAAVGVGVGLVMAQVLRWHLIQDEHANIFVLAMALFTFAVCEAILHESGVLAVIVAGFCLGVARPRQLKQVKRFKLELTELGVGTLFILLAGTLRIDQFTELGWPLVAGVALLTLVIRPVAILMSTWGRGYSLQEKLFLSWVAPRGIVAAFLASLFALELGANPDFAWEAQLLHTFTFAVIGTTVIVQGLSAPTVAKILGLEKEPRRTWMIVGERDVTEEMTAALNKAGARAIGLVHRSEGTTDTEHVIFADPLDRALIDDPRFSDVAAVVAVTPNLYFNELVCERWAQVVGEDACYHWSDAALEGPAEQQRFVGTRIWTDAGTPTELLAQIEADKLDFAQVTVEGDQAFGKHLTPLFRIRGQATSVPNGADVEWEAGDVVVTLRTRVAGLSGLVRDAVVLTDDRPDFETVVQGLLAAAGGAQPDLPMDDLHELIVERERSMPTAMGSGVAIPHAYHDAVTHPACYVANVLSGMTGETPDGKPIRLVFLVLSPSGQAEAHLKSLAAIATLCSDPEYLSLLESQDSAEAIMQRIHERE
jgi:NhaP-type Na+/H+ or K+/H+ antiporter/mannitol/fructose-specific phosphotransferase system IIA component (Ntr-type)